MLGRSPAWRRRRRALSLVVLGAAAIAPAPAQASWPGLNGWLSFSSNRFGTALSGDVFAMPSFGLPQAQLTEVRADDGQSAWSPDGRRIAFKSRRNGNNELYVMGADGSDETRLTNSFRVSEGQPFWSPDGRRLLYRKTPDNPIVQDADIWQIDVDPANPNPRPVLERAGDERYPSYSPDGSKIVFRGDHDLVDHSGDEELYVMDADGTNIVQLTSNDVFDSAPAFSPDGTRLAFESARDSGDALALDIYVMDADGSDVRRLTADPAHDEGPIWSPDGTKIAFTSERGGSSDIWVMNADGSGPRRLTDDPRATSRPTGSRSRSRPPGTPRVATPASRAARRRAWSRPARRAVRRCGWPSAGPRGRTAARDRHGCRASTAPRRRTRSTPCSSTASIRSSRTRPAATTPPATSPSCGATRRSRCRGRERAISRSRARTGPRGA